MRYNGKEYKLAFNLAAWANIEETGIEVDSIKDIMSRKDRVRKIAQIAVIMANAALDKDEIDLDAFMKQTTPVIIKGLYTEIVEAINKGMRMETQDPNRERDLVLEEIEKKSEPTD